MTNDHDDVLDTIQVSLTVDESMYEPVDPSIFDSFDNAQQQQQQPRPTYSTVATNKNQFKEAPTTMFRSLTKFSRLFL